MKLTKTKLKQIIREELNKMLNEAPSRDPGGFMGMHISGDAGPVDTSGIDLSEPSFEQTLADKAIAALEEDESGDYSWIVDMLANLDCEQENDEAVVNDILGAQLGRTLEELL
jgi:hypothetical protein